MPSFLAPEKGKHFIVRWSNLAFCQRSNQIFVPLCLCASVPCPDKTKIAKQVPARCGHLVELHVKSDRQQSAFVLLFLLCLWKGKQYIRISVQVQPCILPTIKSNPCAFAPLRLCALRSQACHPSPFGYFVGAFRQENPKTHWDDKPGLPRLVIPVRFK